MRRILIVLAHPVLERSRLNRRLADAARRVEAVTVHDLYDHYPTLAIHAGREQARLVEHDVVVFQHPFYWYSCPGILKEWQDHVLEHGWAYGHKGTHLRGKITCNAITTGGTASAYGRTGHNRFTVREFLAPWEQTARLCGMRYLAPFTIHDAFKVGNGDASASCDAYVRLLEALRDDRLDLDGAARAENLSTELETLISRATP